MRKSLLNVLFFFSVTSSLGAEVRITDATSFTNFINEVNSGSTYSGTTVFLDSDLSLTGYTSINPIGTSSRYQFRGVFDGQGHVISNLNISSSSEYVGLFGYSEGLIIRNVILDSSCSITNTYSGSSDYVGGVIGYCSGQCNIENNVNMASVTFNGDISYLYFGGIAGRLQSSSNNYNIYVKNCANYGSVTHSGNSIFSSIGGIVGELGYKYYKYIHNCLNYGTITHSGTTKYFLYLGGIAGYTRYAYIENCVSAGMISSPSKSFYIGSLVGSFSSEVYINYCYYTDELSGYKLYGDGTPASSSNTLSYNNTTFELSKDASIGDYTGNSLVDAMNAASDYYVLCGYSHWLLNKDDNTVNFTINSRDTSIEMDYQIILLPSLASEGNITFDGWYNDSEYESLVTVPEVTNDTSLYGKFEINTNNYTITFNTRGGISVDLISAQFGTTVSLPNSTSRDNCKIAFWESNSGDNVGFSFTIPARNITLYAVWKCTHIETPDDFISFSKIVNSGSTYSGTTVILDTDLSFSGYSINPIGCYSGYHFRGVFDGQGYVISNLIITNPPQYIGLFGYSDGLTIRNVVLDSSCSIANSYIGSTISYMGGIIGECEAKYNPCNIENNVNMASVTFNGSIRGNYALYLGGIVGYLYSSNNNNSYVKNCANYGSVTHSGISDYSYIGGVVGCLAGSYYNYIYNCLNYGIITHNDTTLDDLYLGGIVGHSEYAYIENCVSAGMISSPSKPYYNYIGSLVGYVSSETYIKYCYYIDDVGSITLYGRKTPTSESNTPNVSSDVNSTLITNLNSQLTTDNGWNKWLLNLDNEITTFKVNNNKGFSLSSQIILLPDLVVNLPFVFSGWYTDPYYNDPFQFNEVSEGMTLYSLFKLVVKVTFNPVGGNVAITSKNVLTNSSYGELPTPNMTGHTFVGWFMNVNELVSNETKVTITNNHTLNAQWTINNYTITFNFSNGTEPDVRTLVYNSTIIYPNITEREGYTSNGWDKELNTVPANNLIITALWTINNYTITFNFSNGTEPDVRVLDFNSLINYPNITEREGYTFNGWDKELKTIPANNLTITALWTINNYTITFNFSNGTEPDVRTLDYNSTINYPNITEREGYTSNGWDNDTLKFMPAEDITVTAQWNPNNYTVTLDVNGGNELDYNEITVTFNDIYGELPVPTREGYLFIGWFNEYSENITSETIVKLASDHTLYAHWKEIPTNMVLITFNTIDLNKKEITAIIKQYTNDKYTIVSFEDTLDEIILIIKFNNVEDAIKFVDTIRSTSDSATKNVIKDIKYTESNAGSFSPLPYPFIPFIIFIL